MSPCTTLTSSSRTPSSSAASWASVVSWPWPFDCRPVVSVTVPSGSIGDADGVEVVEAREALRGGDLAGPGALLDERAEADAEVAALRAQLALPLAELVVADQLARRGGSTRRSCRRRSCSRSRSGTARRPGSVAEPQLDRVDAERARRVVDQRLARRLARRPADAAVGGRLALVRDRRVDLRSGRRRRRRCPGRIAAAQSGSIRLDHGCPGRRRRRRRSGPRGRGSGRRRRSPARARRRPPSAWPLAARSSYRSSTHFTGAPSAARQARG